MIPLPQPPAPELELDRTDLFGRYLLKNRADVLFVLRALAMHKALVTVYIDASGHFFLSTVLKINEEEDRLYLDPAQSETMNDRALKAERPVVTAQLDRVKVQFPLPGLESVNDGGNTVLAAPLPQTLLRLQRREFFRLEIPATPILHCQLTIARPDGSPLLEEFRVLDLSGGGVCLAVPERLAPLFVPGTVTGRCRIALPEEGIIGASLRVCSAVPYEANRGAPMLRVGCEFSGLPGAQLSLLQRYIMRRERQESRHRAG